MAYVTATIIEKSPPQDGGRVWITAEFTGDAGEGAVQSRYLVGPVDTGQSIRQWAIGIAAGLNSMKSVVDALTVGQSVNLTPIASPAPPAPTAKDIWRDKVRRYGVLSGTVWVGALATDLNALKADIEATYVNGYV